MTTMADARVGVAMLGAGSIAEYHLAGMAAAGGAEVRVIVGSGSPKAAALAARFEVPQVMHDWRAALARTDVDAVVIATPDDTHETIAVAAAEAGKAILPAEADGGLGRQRSTHHRGRGAGARRPPGELHAPVLRGGRAGAGVARGGPHRACVQRARAQRDTGPGLGRLVLHA
jgi:hypothetical protein